VTFWNWRRGASAGGGSTSTAETLTTELAPVELYTAESRIVGWVAANGQRVTDLLNQSTELRLWRPSPGASAELESVSLAQAGQLAQPHDTDAGEWRSLPTEAVLLAMPPEWRASRQLRLHRRLRRVALSVGPFAVTGNVHLHPGVEPGPHLLNRGQQFLPLTEAYLLHQAEPHFEHVVSVVIVNTRHVTQLTPLISLA
jgi:hypothetical protein